MIRMIDVIGEEAGARKERLFSAMMIVGPTDAAAAAAAQVEGQTDRAQAARGRRLGRGVVVVATGTTTSSGELCTAARSFGGELPAVVQREAAREEDDGACEGKRDGDRCGWRRAVGCRDQWRASAAVAVAVAVAGGGQIPSQVVGRCAAARGAIGSAGVCWRCFSRCCCCSSLRVRVGGTV